MNYQEIFKDPILKLYNWIIPKDSVLRSNLYNWFLWTIFPDPLDELLLQLVRDKCQLKFIEIGANDGITFDPLYKFIRKFNWKGILVEPHPYYFDQLKKNYQGLRNKKISFANVALAEKSGKREFFYFDVSGLTKKEYNFYKCICSLDQSHLEKLKSQNPKLKIKSTEVVTTTLMQLIEGNSLQDVDLVMIDAEGKDYEIIRSIDFTKINPKIIYYEHFHIEDTQKESLSRLLTSHGYRQFEGKINTIAYQ